MSITREKLKEKQSKSLDWKIQASLNVIAEWYEAWKGQVYVSFSGGKDSTVLLHLARSIYPDIEAVFSNTGLEYPEIVSFVKSHENVMIIKPIMPFQKVIKEHGWPVVSKEHANKLRKLKNPHPGNESR